jgi:hypothetical protein
MLGELLVLHIIELSHLKAFKYETSTSLCRASLCTKHHELKTLSLHLVVKNSLWLLVNTVSLRNI